MHCCFQQANLSILYIFICISKYLLGWYFDMIDCADWVKHTSLCNTHFVLCQELLALDVINTIVTT